MFPPNLPNTSDRVLDAMNAPPPPIAESVRGEVVDSTLSALELESPSCVARCWYHSAYEADGVRADEARMTVDLRARFHTAAARHAAREGVRLLLRLWRLTGTRAELVGAVQVPDAGGPINGR